MLKFLVCREKFLNRREDYPSGACFQKFAQVGSVLSLHRWLAQKFMASGKGPKELVVKIVSVSDDDYGWILHSRMCDDPTCIKGHC